MIASSLFHFTKESKTVIKIIESLKFRASYNIEDVSDFYPAEKHIGIPMVCFCDIPLKFISEHPMVYGKFGIGLSKEWGLSKGINPILYRSENTTISEYFNQIIKAAKTKTSGSSELFALTLINDKTIRLSSFSKKYKLNNTVNYLDREWRFIPEIVEIPFIKGNILRQKNSLNKNYFSRSPDYLSFKLKDIKYIIAPNKKEVSKLMRELQDLSIEENHKYFLSQLIIDLSSIKKDF